MGKVTSARTSGMAVGLRRFPSLRRGAWLAVLILVFWGIVGVLAPVIAPHAESEILTNTSFAPPGQVTFLGTDYLGRDVLSRLIYGTRMTLGLAFLACCIAFFTGTILGFFAAMSGWVDNVLSRINDALLAFPSIMLALICISVSGPSQTVLVATVGLIEATRVFRIARAVGMNVNVMDFVEVARARGESYWWIIWNEILPNSLVPLSTDFGLRFTYSILLVSSISFLGLGVQPPHAEWGTMVRENLSGLYVYATAVVIPALAIFSVTFAVNALVDWNLSRMRRDISDEMIK